MWLWYVSLHRWCIYVVTLHRTAYINKKEGERCFILQKYTTIIIYAPLNFTFFLCLIAIINATRNRKVSNETTTTTPPRPVAMTIMVTTKIDVTVQTKHFYKSTGNTWHAYLHGHRYYIAYGVTGFMVPLDSGQVVPQIVYTRMGGTPW